MKGKTAFEAMEGIDPRYVLEAAPDAPIHAGNKTRYLRILAVAAMVAALTAVAVLGAGIMKQSGENPPVVPPVEDSQDVQTPTEGESEIATPQNGSYSTDLYTVEEIDGKHYINFLDGNEKPTTNNSGNTIVTTGIYFQSVEELRQKFLTGAFTADEVKNLKAQLTLTDHGFEIPDMTNLHDAVLPEGWSVPNVLLDGSSLYIQFQNDSTYNVKEDDYSGEHGFIGFYSEQHFEGFYDIFFASYVERIKDNLVEDETTFMGVPCYIYEHTTSSSKIRTVIMEIESENSTFEIMLKYYLDHKDINKIDLAIPYEVHMFGEIDEVRTHIWLSGLENEPDLDFLQSFGVRSLE